MTAKGRCTLCVVVLALVRFKCGSRVQTRRSQKLYAPDIGCVRSQLSSEKFLDQNVGYPSFSRHFFEEFSQKNVRLKRPPFRVEFKICIEKYY